MQEKRNYYIFMKYDLYIIQENIFLIILLLFYVIIFIIYFIIKSFLSSKHTLPSHIIIIEKENIFSF